MKTLEEKRKEAIKKYCLNDEMHESIFAAGYSVGATDMLTFISVTTELPELEQNVICKVQNCSFCGKYAIGYLSKSATYGLVWIIEGHHCTHHENMEENCIISWRPINYA